MPAVTRWGDKAFFDPSIFQFPRSLGLSWLVTMAILEVWPGHSFPWSSEEYSWHSQTTRAPVKRKGSSSLACIEIHDVYHRDHNMVIIIVILINHRGNVAGNLPRHSSHQPGPRAPSVRSNLIMMTTMIVIFLNGLFLTYYSRFSIFWKRRWQWCLCFRGARHLSFLEKIGICPRGVGKPKTKINVFLAFLAISRTSFFW